jgi:hypothetical protein
MIQDVLATIDLHFIRAKTAYEEIKRFEHYLTTKIFDDREKIKTIDSFILRYIKIQDLMGEKLFKEFLICVGDYKANMTFLDILDKLEKLNFINNTTSWMKYRNLRNTLTYEYPNNESEIIAGIKLALTAFAEMEQIYHSMVKYLKHKNLI